MRRSHLAAVVAGLCVVVASFLPWARTGEVRRSGFGLARAASAAGIAEGWPLRLLIAAWFLMPALVAGAWVAGAFHRGRLVGGLVVTAGLVGIVTGAGVIASPAEAEFGPAVSIAAGIAAVAGGGRLAGRRATEDGGRHPRA